MPLCFIIDINECEENPDVCPEGSTCVNKDANNDLPYDCLCGEGFMDLRNENGQFEACAGDICFLKGEDDHRNIH